jgi:hypothetical protein
LMLGEIVPQQRHIPATAVVTQQNLRDVFGPGRDPRSRSWRP